MGYCPQVYLSRMITVIDSMPCEDDTVYSSLWLISPHLPSIWLPQLYLYWFYIAWPSVIADTPIIFILLDAQFHWSSCPAGYLVSWLIFLSFYWILIFYVFYLEEHVVGCKVGLKGKENIYWNCHLTKGNKLKDFAYTVALNQMLCQSCGEQSCKY